MTVSSHYGIVIPVGAIVLILILLVVYLIGERH